MTRRHWGATLARPGRLLVHLLPSTRREWAQALLAELDQIDTPSSAARWVLGRAQLVARGWMDKTAGERIMKTVLATLSIINILMGVVLVGLYLLSTETPLLVPALGIGLAIQGGFTLAYLTGTLESLQPWSLRALLIGQTVAVLVGFFGFVSSALYNVDPPNSDYEYGPLAVGALIAVQAAVALWIFAVRDRTRPSDPALGHNEQF